MTRALPSPARRFALVGLGVGLGLALGGCPADPRDSQAPDQVAAVGEGSITRQMLLRELTWAGIARNEDAKVRERLARSTLEQLIDEQLLATEAAREGLTVPDDDVTREVARAAAGYPPGSFERVLHAEQMTVESYTERVRRRLIVDAFLAQRVKDHIEVDEGELQARYAATAAGDAKPEAVRVRQVLVKTEEEADHILQEIRARRLTMEEAAVRFSVAPEGKSGGLLPWFAQGELPEVFDLAFALAPDQVSDVVASNYGFHIFQVVGRRAAGPEPLDVARSAVERDLRREKERAAIDNLLTRLRAATPVRIDERALAQVIEQLPRSPGPTDKGPDPMPGGSFATSPGEPHAPGSPDEAAALPVETP